ncbi:hypothetical protein DFS33DRAFT_1386762 [Desarmillaria ectypa]|nr:hypothetical protein DFS33DRAFT_1386762 [Desarmillaria ectypa]
MSLPTRKISDHLVNPISFGSMILGITYSAIGSNKKCFKVLNATYNSGCTHWDSADVYADFKDLLEKW